MKKICKWASYKGLWHTECHFYLTTTEDCELAYTFNEIPFDFECPNCGGLIEVIDRKFGRGAR